MGVLTVNQSGLKVPLTAFHTRIETGRGEKWKIVRSHDLWKGKKSIVFSVPGAFTPT